jgi:hypothetical protein
MQTDANEAMQEISKHLEKPVKANHSSTVPNDLAVIPESGSPEPMFEQIRVGG